MTMTRARSMSTMPPPPPMPPPPSMPPTASCELARTVYVAQKSDIKRLQAELDQLLLRCPLGSVVPTVLRELEETVGWERAYQRAFEAQYNRTAQASLPDAPPGGPPSPRSTDERRETTVETGFAALYGCAVPETVVPAAPVAAATCWDSFYGGSVSAATAGPGEPVTQAQPSLRVKRGRRRDSLTFELLAGDNEDEDKDEDGEPALPYPLNSAQQECMFFSFTTPTAPLGVAEPTTASNPMPDLTCQVKQQPAHTQCMDVPKPGTHIAAFPYAAVPLWHGYTTVPHYALDPGQAISMSSMEAPSTDAHACADDTASGNQSMSLAQKKKVNRAATKQIIAVLDALLPPTSATSESQRDCVGGRSCGSRSLGRTGRSLIAILQDAAALVRHKKARIESQTQTHLQMRQARAKSIKTARAMQGAAICKTSGKGKEGHSDTEMEPLCMPTEVPGIMKGGMLSSFSMLTIEVSFPTCRITSVGSGFVSLIQQRVSNTSQTFSLDAVEDIVTKMTLYHFIHPEDVQLLWMFVKGNFWTYGTVVEDANTITVRVAPPAPTPQTDHMQPDHSTVESAVHHAESTHPDLSHTTATHSHTPDIHLKLIGLDPMTRTGVFVSV